MGDVFVLAFFIIFTVFLHIVNVNQYNVNIINVPIHNNASIFYLLYKIWLYNKIFNIYIYTFIHIYIWYIFDIDNKLI